jgi:hypothetical protein
MEENDELWKKAKKDFPNDPALQEVHYARLKIHEQTKGMSDKDFRSLDLIKVIKSLINLYNHL